MPNQVGCLPFFPVMPHNHSSPGQGGQLDETSWGNRLKECYYYYGATDTLLQSNDTEKSTNDVSGILLKEITLTNIEQHFIHYPYNNDVFRIKFDIHTSNASYQASAGVYKNGTLVGTLQNTTSTSYITISQDLNLGNLAVGDKIQIYGLIADPSAYCYIRNFRIYGGATIYYFKNIDFSNQITLKPQILYIWVAQNIFTFTNTLT
jgi:hypothetical protein